MFVVVNFTSYINYNGKKYNNAFMSIHIMHSTQFSFVAYYVCICNFCRTRLHQVGLQLHQLHLWVWCVNLTFTSVSWTAFLDLIPFVVKMELGLHQSHSKCSHIYLASFELSFFFLCEFHLYLNSCCLTFLSGLTLNCIFMEKDIHNCMRLPFSLNVLAVISACVCISLSWMKWNKILSWF